MTQTEMKLVSSAIRVAGLSPAEIGLLFMIHNLGASVAYLPAGMMADHVANRGILLAATFFWVCLGYLAASFADSFWTFALLIAVAGMGDAAWHPIATGVLAQIHKARRAYALAQVRQYPDTALRMKAREVEEFDEPLTALAERMTTIMRDARGVGCPRSSRPCSRRYAAFVSATISSAKRGSHAPAPAVCGQSQRSSMAGRP